MKITRQKRIKRYLKFYRNHFQFKLPYQVIIDGTFCYEALQCKINIKDQLPNYLEDENVRLYTTACVIKEMELLGSRVYGALHIVKQFLIRKCGHEKDSLSGSDCVLSLLEKVNPHHFIIATTDPDLSEKCRAIAGVPILFVKYNAIILEKPSEMNQTVAQDQIKEATELTEFEKRQGEISKKKSKSEEEEPKKKKRKGPKQPNPLSCLKKKKTAVVTTSVAKEAGRRKRNRKKNRGMMPTVE